MPYDPNKHHRRSIRLRGYDYAQGGWYFVTVCAQGGECLFGDIIGGEFQANTFGQIVLECLAAVPEHFAGVAVDTAVVMPNHLHMIIVLPDAPVMPARPTLGQIVAYLKYQSTRRVNELRDTPGARLWQRNYYEHIIRDAGALARIRTYIANNPQQWELDQLRPRQ